MSRAATFEPVFDVYLSGPITGDVRGNTRKFNEAADALRKMGYRVFSPVEGEPIGLEWSQYIRRDLAYLVDSRMIALLPGWTRSKGARLERRVALGIGMQVHRVEDLLDGTNG